MFSINGLNRDRHSLKTLLWLVNEGTTESASEAFETWVRARVSREKNNSDPRAPFSTYQTNNPEDLWDWMESYQDKTGGRLLASPNNDNFFLNQAVVPKGLTPTRQKRYAENCI